MTLKVKSKVKLYKVLHKNGQDKYRIKDFLILTNIVYLKFVRYFRSFFFIQPNEFLVSAHKNHVSSAAKIRMFCYNLVFAKRMSTSMFFFGGKGD